MHVAPPRDNIPNYSLPAVSINENSSLFDTGFLWTKSHNFNLNFIEWATLSFNALGNILNKINSSNMNALFNKTFLNL